MPYNFLGDQTGYSVAGAGDVNGDGIADLVIGAPGARSTFVVFGKTAGFAAKIDLSSLDGTNGFRIDGANPRDIAVTSLAGAGDVNGDGVADLVFGAPYEESAFVLFGKTTGFAPVTDLASLDGTNGFSIDGVQSRTSGAGLSVSGAGDVNGDGIADLVIGAPGVSPNGKFFAGSTYVVFGTASGFRKRIDVSLLDGANGFRIDGATTSAHSGRSVAAGDVNGDGVTDLIIAAPGIAKTFVVFGRR
jgi:hypothetical protein